jgi:hypothetical protein
MPAVGEILLESIEEPGLVIDDEDPRPVRHRNLPHEHVVFGLLFRQPLDLNETRTTRTYRTPHSQGHEARSTT